MKITTSAMNTEFSHVWRDRNPVLAASRLEAWRLDVKARGLVEIAPDESRPGFTTYRAILPRPVQLPAVRTFMGDEPEWLRFLGVVAMCWKWGPPPPR